MKFILILAFIATYSIAFAQVDTLNYSPHNTIKVETYVTKSDIRKGKLNGRKHRTKYHVDGKRAKQEKYELAMQQSGGLADCKPCWLRYYDTQGRLLQEGLSYSDCALGKRTEYYPSGKPKVIRYYKTNETGDWSNFPCSVAEGTWTYFREDGSIEKTEVYKDGKKVE